MIDIIIFLVSLVPSILILVWMMKRKKEDLLYRKSAKSALIRGLICVLPIVAASATFSILNNIIRLTLLPTLDPLIYKVIYNFIVLALAEELVKFLVFKFLLKKKYNAYTWADVVAFMVIIGAAFGLIEDIPYAIGSNPIEMILRGVAMGHVGYAFIMGWFYGKRLYTGKKPYGVIAFLLPYFLHGLYDFSLSPEFLALNDNLAIVGVGLAVLEVILAILMIRYFIRSKKIERYNQPLIPAEEVAAQQASGS